MAEKEVEKYKVVLYARKAKNLNLTPRIIPRSACLDDNFNCFNGWTAYPSF